MESTTTPKKTPPLVLISLRTGDLWRMFPSAIGTRIPSEEDLIGWEEMNRLQERFALPLPPEQGDEFACVDFGECQDCKGSGLEVCDAWIGGEYVDDHGYTNAFQGCVEHGSEPTTRWGEPRGLHIEEDHEHDCCRCDGTGRGYDLESGAVIQRSEIPALCGASRAAA
jgi:hypothetical protein